MKRSRTGGLCLRLSHNKPISFDCLVHVPAREQIVYCLIVASEREP
jgi:hypothetical protein